MTLQPATAGDKSTARRLLALLEREDLEASRVYFARSCEWSRKHSHLAGSALRTHGDHGAQVSGCVRDHFPEEIKNELRFAARSVSLYSDLAYAEKPARVRMATLRLLAQAVATRDGAGFYGAQGYVGAVRDIVRG